MTKSLSPLSGADVDGLIQSSLAQRSATGEVCCLRLLGCQGRAGGSSLARVPLARISSINGRSDLAAVYACDHCASTLQRTSASGYPYIHGILLRALVETHHRMAVKGILRFTNVRPSM